MTSELKNKIRNELNKAFVHCGETDHNIIIDRAEEELDTLMCFMAGSEPTVINTDQGEMTGYLVDIAVASGAANNEIVALQMIVTRDSIKYILHSRVTNKPDGWQPGDIENVESETNRVVELSEVDPAMFC